MKDAKPLAADERRDLADLLDKLTAEQWEMQSLCPAWTVRQVVVHIVSYEDLGILGAVGRLARAGFSLDRANPIGVDAEAAASTDEVLDRLRTHLRPRGVTAAFRGRIALTDGLIHHQDIRRALGIPRTVPPERLLEALPFSLRARALPSRRDVNGLRLVATDLDWAHGDGPEVTGTGEALLMAVAGRRAALGDLDGPGVPLLRAKMETRLAGTVR